MYCTKCGKKANPGDRFCAGCGVKLGSVTVETEKRSGGFGRIVTVILVILLGLVLFIGREEWKQEEHARWGRTATETAVSPEPMHTYYSDGSLHTTTTFHGNGNIRYVEERNGDGLVAQAESYRENGMLWSVTQYSYSGSDLRELTMYTYDEHGNVISFDQQYGDGTTCNCYYYSYEYDDMGRVVYMSNFNQNGVLMQEEYRNYYSDGSYIRDYTEYRGANTYDWEFDMGDPDVAHKWYHALIECDAQGNERRVMCDFSDGYEQDPMEY